MAEQLRGGGTGGLCPPGHPAVPQTATRMLGGFFWGDFLVRFLGLLNTVDVCLRGGVGTSCLRMAQIGSLMVKVGREID